MKSERQPISLIRILFAVLATVTVAWYGLRHFGEVQEYWQYFTEARPAIDLRYEELAGDWTEQSLRARFPSQRIRCYADSSHGLGDTVCALDVGSNKGVPTLFVSFFFANGRLNAASFNVPWWAHSEALDYIVANYGEPYAAQEHAYSGVRLIGWKLSNGSALFYNRDRDYNPLIWNSVFWNSPEWCARKRCFDGGYL